MNLFEKKITDSPLSGWIDDASPKGAKIPGN